jgi:hypothetical protein
MLNNLNKNNQDEQNKINIFHKLRDKKSVDIITELYKYINERIDNILKNEKATNIPIVIQEFISQITSEFLKLWNLDKDIHRAYYYEEIINGFENLITKSVYPKLMNIFQDESGFDKFYKKFSNLTLEHLGLEIFLDEFELDKQIKQLREINDYQAPREKVNLVVNFCNYLGYKYPKLERNKFMKLLAFTILQAQVPKIKMNIKFISSFRHKTTVTSEENYYILQFNKAIEFIKNLEDEGNKELNITKKDYIMLVEEGEKKDPFLISDSKRNVKGIFIII